MTLGNIFLDSNLIPSRKIRLEKEAFELFRRACNLQETVHMLSLAKTPSQKIMGIYQLSIMELEKQRNEIIKEAIERYQMSQEEKE